MSSTSPKASTKSDNSPGAVQNKRSDAKPNAVDLFGYLLLGSSAVALACIVIFGSYMLPMIMLESIVQGDTEKIIISPFENYSPSVPYHITKSCLWPIFYEELENSFACSAGSLDFNSILVNQTVYCPDAYGCMSRLEYPYVYCISLDLSCSGVDVSTNGLCWAVAAMEKYDDYSKIISFETNTVTAGIQLMAEILLITSLIFFAIATVFHCNDPQLSKKKIAFPYAVFGMFVVAYFVIFVAGVVYLCLVDGNITSAGDFAGDTCFDSKAKEQFRAISSRYYGTLVMFTLSIIVTLSMISPLCLMFGAFHEEIKKSSYQIVSP